MSKSLYITSVESRSGKSAISLGVMSLLIKENPDIAFFRPIIRDLEKNQKDNDIELIRKHFHLKIPYEESYVMTLSQARELLSQNKKDIFLDKILERYHQLQKKYAFILCEGTDLESATAAFEFDVNLLIAENLGSPIFLVYNAWGKSVDKIIAALEVATSETLSKKIELSAIAINRVKAEQKLALQDAVAKSSLLANQLILYLDDQEALNKPTLLEALHVLNAQILHGQENLNRTTQGYIIGAMQVNHFMPQVFPQAVVITPGDRLDIILGCTLCNIAGEKTISGIILTGGLRPDEKFLSMLNKIQLPFPILLTKYNTYETAKILDSIHAKISSENTEKISLALSTFEKATAGLALNEKIKIARSTKFTPKMFEFYLIEKAKASKKHIVLPEGEEGRILKATEIISQRDLAQITLLGNEEKILKTARQLGINLEKVKILNPENSSMRQSFAEEYYELRKHKGISPQMALELMTQVNYFGTMMVHRGLADGMVSGSIHTTAETIRPALQIIKTQPGISIVSSVFFMCLEDRVLVYGDCAINPNPSAEELAQIALASAKTAEAFGIKPLVAMLSYSTGSSGQGEDVEKVRKATEIVRQKNPNLLVEGPIQYDAAIDPEVAKTKMPQSPVAGKATVFIFPDLNTGNNTYKAVQRSAHAIAIGPVLQGLKKPVNDLSRGATVADIVNTIAITAIQAAQIS